MTTLKELKAKSLKNPKIKAAYDQLEDEYALAASLIDALTISVARTSAPSRRRRGRGG